MDLYAVLGVSPGADVKEIRKAYHRLAQKYHPDHNQDNPEAARRFMEISAAWRVLRDKAARADYDRQAADRPSGESAGAGRSRQRPRQASSAGSRPRPQAETVDFTDMAHSFERYFGFDPKTGEVTDETKLDPQAGKKKNPLDTSELFEKFMGFKAR